MGDYVRDDLNRRVLPFKGEFHTSCFKEWTTYTMSPFSFSLVNALAIVLAWNCVVAGATIRHKDIHSEQIIVGVLTFFPDEKFTYGIETRMEILDCPPENPKHPIDIKCSFKAQAIFSLSRDTNTLAGAVPYIVPGMPSAGGILANGTDLRTKNFDWKLTTEGHLDFDYSMPWNMKIIDNLAATATTSGVSLTLGGVTLTHSVTTTPNTTGAITSFTGLPDEFRITTSPSTATGAPQGFYGDSGRIEVTGFVKRTTNATMGRVNNDNQYYYTGDLVTLIGAKVQDDFHSYFFEIADTFDVTKVIPEPSTVTLFGMGALAILYLGLADLLTGPAMFVESCYSLDVGRTVSC